MIAPASFVCQLVAFAVIGSLPNRLKASYRVRTNQGLICIREIPAMSKIHKLLNLNLRELTPFL